jgi:hypothetical protein
VRDGRVGSPRHARRGQDVQAGEEVAGGEVYASPGVSSRSSFISSG